MNAERTLFEAVGGLDGLCRLSNAFYEGVLADELLAPVFANFTVTHVDHVALWLAEIFGGPATFSAELGGHQALLNSHLGLRITEEHRARWLELMSDAIEQTLPAEPQLRRQVFDYFEWGTAIAREVSQDPVGTDLGTPGPTPRWGWQGLIKHQT
ncbi:globin [Nocardia uniformis]|uniref:Globin n=1 Tax=Nocardia uniformis TaxID=53432 RepID=A0A849CE80_9NOCA|nr:group II truncated hemoglobin [Nocardia uniformis]NNH74910.1 globin [Nocardia uniformis]